MYDYGEVDNNYITDMIFQDEKNEQEQKKFSEKVISIVESSYIEKIKYGGEYDKVFEYINEKFPSVDIFNVLIYRVSRRVMRRLGFSNAAGFFDKINKIVVLSPNVNNSKSDTSKYLSNYKFSVGADVVLVHELCHYCDDKISATVDNLISIEEFAYGHSIEYLKRNGYTDNDIINHYFFPFLQQISSDEALYSVLVSEGVSFEDFDSWTGAKKQRFFRGNQKMYYMNLIKICREKGEKIIRCYSDSNRDVTKFVDLSKANRKLRNIEI